MMKINISRKQFLYSLDIGSKKITLAAKEIAQPQETHEIFIETQPTKGIFKGVVHDLASLVDSMQQLFKKMEARCGEKALRVALSINGNYINARTSGAAVALSERGMRSVTKRDIYRINRQARILGIELEESLLHEYPLEYSIDRHNVTLSPLGLHGRKFEVELLLICAKAVFVENIVKAVEQAGLDVVNIVFSGIAASRAVLSEEEKKNGTIFIDIGDALTGVLIFKQSQVRKIEILSFGGKNLSEIISNYCKIPLELADEIKETGLDISDQVQEEEEVMIKTEYDYKPVKKKELVSVILPELDRFTDSLRRIIFDCGVSDIKQYNIVVTGGMGLLSGLLEKIERDLELPVKLGLIKTQSDISRTKAPAYAAAVGLIDIQQEALNNTGLKFQVQGKNKLSRAIDYVTSLYQDYF